jgi:hypothetical protein
MAATIESSTSAQFIPPAPVAPQQIAAKKDSDGDTDGSKAGEVEKPKATATLGNNVNVKA